MSKEIIVDGLFFLETKDNEIRFTSDNPDFKNLSIDKILEDLYKKFKITRSKIIFHVHEEKNTIKT